MLQQAEEGPEALTKQLSPGLTVDDAARQHCDIITYELLLAVAPTEPRGV